MIAGTEAFSRYFSEEAVTLAEEPNELFLVEGATHMSLYDHQGGRQARRVFRKALAASLI